MRRAEPLEPEVEAALEAIDATLAGEPVDPEFAELAELSLILRSEAPAVRPVFGAELDGRVAGRFGRSPRAKRRWRRPQGWLVPAGAVALVAAAVAVPLATRGGGNSSSANFATSGTSVSAGGALGGAGGDSGVTAGGTTAAPTRAPSTNGSAASKEGTKSASPVPSNPLHRKIVQGAQLSLATRPGAIDTVSQRVFGVVGSEQGYVASSSVTSTGHPDSSARFQLEVPSARLQRTLTRLSQVSGASVLSSTNTSHDITGQVGGAGRRLAEYRALRRSLLKQLSGAFTTTEIDQLKARIARVNRTIDRDQAALTSLDRKVSYSRISLTIQGSTPAHKGHHGSGGGGFTLRRAGHDALHVLVVAAGVLLIGLAVAIPIGLVAALLSWVWLRARRRSRESALDQA